jgi:hypothetical protein
MGGEKVTIEDGTTTLDTPFPFLSSLDRFCKKDRALSDSLLRNPGLSKYLFYEFISNPGAVLNFRNVEAFRPSLETSVLWYMNYRHLFLEGHVNSPLESLGKEWRWHTMKWPEYWKDRFIFQKGLIWQKIL